MILTIDVGNSNTVVIGYDNDEIIYKKRMITEKKNVKEYYESMFDIKEEVQHVVLSCVVPAVFDVLIETMEEMFHCEVFVVNSETVPSLNILLENPLEIGSDFIATTMGAMDKYDLPFIVADVGSATKLTYTDETGSFRGGAILPGLGVSLKALHDFIPHLPSVDIKMPEKAIGNSTSGAIQSGIMYGLIGQIEGIAKRMESQRGKKCVKIITGGYASLIKDHLEDFVCEPNLLNDGLYAIYKKEFLENE